jgi:hypothetical protein
VRVAREVWQLDEASRSSAGGSHSPAAALGHGLVSGGPSEVSWATREGPWCRCAVAGSSRPADASRAWFRFQNSPLNFTMQKGDSPSH